MYDYATSKSFGFLFIDFHPKEEKYRFRCMWDELLLPEEIAEKEELIASNNKLSVVSKDVEPSVPKTA
jgi:hypothetical protein